MPTSPYAMQTKSGKYITGLSVKTWTSVMILTQSSSDVTANIYFARKTGLAWTLDGNWTLDTVNQLYHTPLHSQSQPCPNIKTMFSVPLVHLASGET